MGTSSCSPAGGRRKKTSGDSKVVPCGEEDSEGGKRKEKWEQKILNGDVGRGRQGVPPILRPALGVHGVYREHNTRQVPIPWRLLSKIPPGGGGGGGAREGKKLTGGKSKRGGIYTMESV